MRLCSFSLPGEDIDTRRVGLVDGAKVFQLAEMTDMMELLRQGASRADLEPSGDGHEIGSLSIHAPIWRPGKILGTIVNTQAMLGGSDIRLDRPRVDMKAPSTVVGPGTAIRAPAAGIRPEVELAAIVGRKLSKASKKEALEGIFGYAILNDVTSPRDAKEDAYEAYRRDRTTGEIRKTMLRGPLFRSKNHDTFCPMGPWVVTPDENKDWADLKMTTKFGDLLVQEGSTNEYLFSPQEIISYVSEFLTLEPGDVVSCGSVGWTKEVIGNLDPTEYVLPQKAGSLLLEIEGIGALQNPVRSAD
jgi:2-keto-4-pentenoate hydratase/2-oxohepta-3-ene-1,7-dioic acid hydratase in catechol pathway